ncbi:MAG: hypothetical protein CMI30_08350 [Opitutae bacterium]|nr:hypothetical protein [Opitutae bacterium]
MVFRCLIATLALATVVQSKEIGWDIGELKTLGLKGERSAQLRLGLAYSSGIGVEKNVREAFYWYEKAAKLGDPVASHYLARAYAKGTGTHRDPKKVVHWYREAALGSNASARQQLVGLLRAKPSGSPERAESYAWCLIGTEAGDKKLKVIRDLMMKQESAVTLSAGKAKAIELQDSITSRMENLLPIPRTPNRGNYRYPSGERYFGQVQAGRPHGHGIVVTPQGDRFYGEFRDGRANGHGMLFDKSGRVLFSGLWQNDKPISDDGMPLPLAFIGSNP